jgi:hypothetical protein
MGMTILAFLPLITSVLDKILPDPQAQNDAKLKVLELAQNGELAKDTELYKSEQVNITQRQQADMSSDSWLSKNIRPMTLIAILAGYFTFAFMSAYGVETNKSYVELLGQWGMLIMSFYFGGRTLEKIMDLTNRSKSNGN